MHIAANKQSTLAAWLVGKGFSSGQSIPASSPASADAAAELSSICRPPATGSGAVMVQSPSEQPLGHSGSEQQCSSTPADVFRDLSAAGTVQTSQHSNISGIKRSVSTVSGGSKARVGGNKRSKPQQSSMRQFFVTRDAAPAAGAVAAAVHPSTCEAPDDMGVFGNAADDTGLPNSAPPQPEVAPAVNTPQGSDVSQQAAADSAGAAEPSNGSGLVSRDAAAAAWQNIQQKMKPPKCKGHKEDCLIQKVKKNCPNKGVQPLLCTCSIS